jgi:type IV secretion system protein VirB2
MMASDEQAPIVAAIFQFQLGTPAKCALSPFCRLSQTIPIGAQGGLVRLTTKIAGCAVFLAGLFSAATAQAQELADPQGSGVLVSAVQWLQGTLLGTVATVVAVIAVATVGFMMLTGRINWRYGATVILGCFILFGAASIVAGIQSTASLGR